MELSPGYKQTEVGVLPEDWGVKAVDKLAFVTSGKRLPAGHSLVDDSTPHPYVRVTDMRPGTVSLSEIKFVPEAAFAAIKKYRIFSRDLFISVAGTLGIIGAVPPELDGANLTENADRITDIECSQKYLMYVLMSPLIQNQIESIRTVGAQPKLALARIRKFEIPVPPPSEQVNIAEALSDAYTLIESLESLIAKKRAIKQGAMQELLFGRRRLPGFDGKWAMQRFGDVADIRNNKVNTYESPEAAFCVELEQVEQATGQLLGHSDARDRKSVKYAFRKGDVLFGRLRPYLRKYWLAECDGVCSTEIWPLIPKNDDISAAFLAQIVKTDAFIEAASSAYGTHMPRSDWKALCDYEVMLPSCPDEQNSIAQVLSEMDDELEALTERLVKGRQIKQGMMQELLMGRVRLL